MADYAAQIQRKPIDKDAIRERYRAERDKRLRTDGNDQYTRIAGLFDEYLEDPYTPVTPRAPKTDHVTFAFVGGGFAGLVTGARLKEAGINDVRIIEKGGDFGGTWYWNRYPGAQCDTASMIYMPLLEDRAHAEREVCARAGNPAAVPAHLTALRALRECPLPHCHRGAFLGRGAQRLGHPHEPRRQLHGKVYRPRHRPAEYAEAARHSRHQGLQRPRLPHQPLGLRLYRRRSERRAAGQAQGQARSHHRHRRHRRAGRPASRARRQGALCFPAHAVVHRCTRQPSDRSGMVRLDRNAGLAAALAGKLHAEPGGYL